MIILQICPVVRWRFYMVKKLDLPGKALIVLTNLKIISYHLGSLVLYFL